MLSTIEYCSTDLSAAGQRSSLVSPLLVNSLFCVSVDNNEVIGEFYTSPAEESMAVATAFLRNPKAQSFTAAVTSDTSTDMLSAAISTININMKDAYEPGDMIKIFMPSTSSETVRGPVLMGFGPTLGSNECWDADTVGFELSKAAAPCTRIIKDVEDECARTSSPFALASWVNPYVLVAKYPNVTRSDAESISSSVLNIEFEAYELNDDTGELVVLDDTVLLNYFMYPELDVDSTTNETFCYGMLDRLELSIEHDGEGHLSGVHALVVVKNVAASDASFPVSITQSFGYSFSSTQESIDPSDLTLANGNLETYSRSGNPGYLTHYPVRVGILATNTTPVGNDTTTESADVISEMIDGLKLPGLGDCNVDMALHSTVEPIIVNFGEDSHMVCTLALTADEFEELCTGADPVPPSLRVNFTHVARFGNSDPFLASGWLELDYEEPTANSAKFVQSDSSTLQCQGIITGLHLELLVANVGPAASPQRKIVAARASHSSENLRFWNVGQTETFLLYTTVTFVWIHSAELEALIPSPPPVWFSIPSDVFYPFMLSSAQQGHHLSLLALLLSMVASVLISMG